MMFLWSFRKYIVIVLAVLSLSGAVVYIGHEIHVAHQAEAQHAQDEADKAKLKDFIASQAVWIKAKQQEQGNEIATIHKDTRDAVAAPVLRDAVKRLPDDRRNVASH